MGMHAMILVFRMLSFKPAFPFFSCTFIKRLFSSSLLSAIKVVSSAYLRLWLFVFLLASWFLLMSHPAQHFIWCTLHIHIFPSRIWYFIGKQWSKNVLKWQNTWCSSPKVCVTEVWRTERFPKSGVRNLSLELLSLISNQGHWACLYSPQGCTSCWGSENTVSCSLTHRTIWSCLWRLKLPSFFQPFKMLLQPTFQM